MDSGDRKKDPAEWAMEVARFIDAKRVENLGATAATEEQLVASAQEIARLHVVDGIPKERIREMAEWACADVRPEASLGEFLGWGYVVQSGKALRRHWHQVAAQMEHAQPGARLREVEALIERQRRNY